MNNFPNNIWLWPKYQIICTIFFCLWILFKTMASFSSPSEISQHSVTYVPLSDDFPKYLALHLRRTFFFFFFCPFEKKEVLLLFAFKFFSCMVSKLFLTFFFSTLKFCYTWSLNPFTGVFCSYQNCKWKMTFLFWHIPPEVYHDGSDEACTGKCKCADHLNHMHQYMQSCEIIMNKINK